MSNFFFEPPHLDPLKQQGGREIGTKRKGYEIQDFDDPGNENTAYLGISIKPRAMRLFFILLTLVFLLFIGRALFLQILNGSSYLELAEGNRTKLEILPATRGKILDQNGKILTSNLPYFALAIRPAIFPKKDPERADLIETIAQDGISRIEITEKIEKYKNQGQWIYLSENLEHDQAMRLMIKYQNTPAVMVVTNSIRKYTTEISKSLSQTLGYVGTLSEKELSENPDYGSLDVIGKAGVELFYEKELRGIPGGKHVEVDALGNEINVIAQKEPVDGRDLITGIDLELQEKAEEVLSKNLEAAQKKQGVVIALDPNNGEIRALVSLPSFDSNDFAKVILPEIYKSLSEDENRPLFNRAISGNFQSGSTIKPVFAVAALTEGIITPSTTILSTGGIQVSRWFFPDWRAGGHGPTDVYHAVADSVNTFFYYIGGGYGNFKGLGPEKLAAWARRFGLSYKTGIDLPYEAAGFIPTPDWKERERGEQWYIGDTYNFSIGQGDVLVTPLQMAHVIATIANGGTRYQPHIATGFQDNDGQVEKIPVPSSEIKTLKKEDIKTVQEAMRRAVTEGSARQLSLLPISAAGKTGTAQWSSTGTTHAWFIGYAPFENPQIVIVVLGEKCGEGSVFAAPVAYEILSWWAENRMASRE